MAEKYSYPYQQQQQQQVYPLAPSSIVPRSDAGESAQNYESMELRQKKRKKRIAYIAAFAVFQTIIILIFALVVMRVKSPKVRLVDIKVTNNINGTNISLMAQLRVKNTNFGRYKFDSSVATVTSGGDTVGQFVIPDGKAGMKSTKKVYVIVDVVNPSGSSFNSGMLELNSQAKLSGKVEFFMVLKKKKYAEMNCTMSVNLSTNDVQNLICK
ncbi:hypothetical protein ACH5RR_038384 [Cinchona calisaya]|uniref:Late embryogenesis abundant protein LEA-2 subgroup domain-containing protein n=1 Tax=Cinchona calisaya TaxID=153742 RepID=A0ABD2XWZ5_9GENT